MAVVVVTFTGTRISEAESDADGGTWDKFGSTQTPTDEVDWPYQLGTNSQAISNQASGGEDGVDVDTLTAGTIAFSTGPKAVLCQVALTTFGLLDTTIHGGMKYYVGSSASAHYIFYLFGSKRGYEPAAGGWSLQLIDPNEAAYRAEVVGSPDLSVVDYFGVQATTTEMVKSDNIGHDSLSFLSIGEGLMIVGGTGSDTPATFRNATDEDGGTVANRWGVSVDPGDGVNVVRGWIILGNGSTAGCKARSDGEDVFFAETLTGAGFTGLLIDLGHADGDVIKANGSLKGRGRGFPKDIIHTIDDVDATNEVITLDTSMSWRDLDYVLYSDEGGTDSIGLTDTNSYWIAWDATNSGWAFYTTRDNAATDTSRVGLTAGSTGENHSFLLTPDTRPDITVTGTNGVQGVLRGEAIDNIRNITLNSKGKLDACAITNVEKITQASGAIEDNSISLATTDLGEALVIASALSGITGNAFTHSRGHAISRAMTTGETLDGNSFSDYGPPHIIFDTEDDVDGTNDEIDYVGHGYATGDGIYYNDKGGTETIGLTDLALYFVRAVTADSMSFHLTPEAAVAGTGKVNLTASGVGNGEDHHLYSADAAILVENGATAVTLTITNANSPSIRSTGSGIVTVSNDVTLTITVEDVDKDPIQNAQTSIYLLDPPYTQLMNEDTTVLGVASASYNYTTPTDIKWRVRKSETTDNPRYFARSGTGQITDSGFTLSVTLEVNPFI